MTADRSWADFDAAMARDRERVNRRLVELVDAFVDTAGDIANAVRYTLCGGGKRLRPILCLWTHDALGGHERERCLDVACALECLHTYSLVHDDLPCMDDDDYRRGQPSCHRKFGEATAVLVGDALLTLCFEILATAPGHRPEDAAVAIDLVRTIAEAAGTRGLIGGQVLDLLHHAGDDDLDAVVTIHDKKTAALLATSMEAGAILAGVTAEERVRVRDAGRAAGQAFQIVDDLLDLQGDHEALGKTPGKDVKDHKLTYPSVAGVDASRRRAHDLIERARLTLPPAAQQSGLDGLLAHLVTRVS